MLCLTEETTLFDVDSYQELLESYFDAIWQLDDQLRLVRFNSRFQDRYRQLYGVDVLVGAVPTVYLPESERSRWQGWYQRALDGHSFSVEERYQLASGEVFLDVLLSPDRDDDGTIRGLHAIAQDVTETRLREMGSVRLAGRLHAVLESAVRMNTAIREPEEVFRETMELISAAIPCTSGTVQLLDGEELKVVQAHGFTADSGILSLRFPLSDRFPNYHVVTTQQTISVADIRQEYPHFLQEDGQYLSGHVRSWMGVPLIDSGEVVGMFTLDRDLVDPFSSDDLQLATALAHHAAVAFRNTRTYSDQNLLLRELHHRVKNTTQLILSLITLQASSVGMEARQVLDELSLRVRTLSAVHESMYVTEKLDQVALDTCVRRVIRELEIKFGENTSASGLRFSTDFQPDTRFPLERAVPFGLLANELLLSLIRRISGTGSVTVILRQTRNSVELELRIHCTEGCLEQDDSAAGIMSRNLREGLLAQVKGTLEEEESSTDPDQFLLVLRAPR